MTSEIDKIEGLLTRVCQTLDIPDHLYEEAILRYEQVGEWLGADDSELKSFSPEIYPQGSFRLGTVIQPVTDANEYDIDLVCRLEIPKDEISQNRLKESVGKRLRQNEELRAALSEMRRCWRLSWSDSFHMDILPAIPNIEKQENGLLITDRELFRWQTSNPIDYSTWFISQMITELNKRRARLAKAEDVEIEAIPEWRVRTPLQRSIQILKRNRDLFCKDKEDEKPASIIITTLAAKAYSNETSIIESLKAIVSRMESFVKKENGKFVVPNPADENENFADKWNETPQKAALFFEWMRELKIQVQMIIGSTTTYRRSEPLIQSLVGTDVVAKALLPPQTDLLTKSNKSLASIPELGDIGHEQPIGTPESILYSAKLKGTVCMGTKRLWTVTKRPLPKNHSLLFEIETNTPPPKTFKWRVTNTGEEARSANDLRGGFIETEEKNYHKETTRYFGTHRIEGFVYKNGVCVARTGPMLIKIRN